MRQLLISSLILVVVAGAAVAFQDNSQERPRQPANEGLAHAVDKLQKELQSLRADVDYLLVLEKYNQEEIGYLEELVRSREAMHRKILSEWKIGVKSTDEEGMARYQLHVARARLAWAKGDMGRCQKEWEATISAAEKLVQVLSISYGGGRVSLELVIGAQAQLTDAKLNLSRMKRKATWKENRS